MAEGFTADKETGSPVYSWWCMTDECRKIRHTAFNKKHENDKQATVDKSPETVLPMHGIPKRYFENTLESFKGHDKMVKSAKSFIEKPARNLFFTGAPGTGKTHLAVAIAREFLRKGISGVFFKRAPELFLDIRRSFDDKSEDAPQESDIISRFGAYYFLVLDDFGAEKVTEYTTNAFQLILDRRLDDGLPTIVTSNLSIQDIRETIDARISSRLSEGEVWIFEGEDYRKRRK